eukprot:5524591-Prymnesium_polylepis.2
MEKSEAAAVALPQPFVRFELFELRRRRRLPPRLAHAKAEAGLPAEPVGACDARYSSSAVRPDVRLALRALGAISLVLVVPGGNCARRGKQHALGFHPTDGKPASHPRGTLQRRKVRSDKRTHRSARAPLRARKRRTGLGFACGHSCARAFTRVRFAGGGARRAASLGSSTPCPQGRSAGHSLSLEDAQLLARAALASPRG